MKIGDKVRFLNATGGGRITAFEGKDLVLVCDEDGFDIPTLRSEIVVIDTNDYNFANSSQAPSKEMATEEAPAPTHSSIKALLNSHTRDEKYADESCDTPEEVDLADLEMSFTSRSVERRGGDVLNVYLAFVAERQASGEEQFAAYVVNDSNYEVQLFLATNEELTRQHLRFVGAVLPNTKELVAEFGKVGIADWEQLSVQLIAYKREKAFALKDAQQVQLRIEGRKFYKASSFKANVFFHTPALIFDLVRNDHTVETLHIDAQALQDQLNTPAVVHNTPARKDTTTSFLEAIDSDTIVIDLHAEKVLAQPEGLERRDILAAQIRHFHQTMQQYRKTKGQKIVFVHGKGEGVLRAAIIKELKSDYRNCVFQDASFREYGFGATLVTVK